MGAQLRTDRLTLVQSTIDEARTQVASMGAADRAQLSPVWLERLRCATTDDPWVVGFNVLHTVTGATATEAAASLVAFALACPDVRLVRAHTLEAENASVRVLTKCGFKRVGQILDPEDGQVWRWEVAAGG